MSVEDPVFYKVHMREGKLDRRWEPYFRIVEPTGPVTFVIWYQMSCRVKRGHVNDLKLAKVNGWENLKPKGKERRKTLAEPEDVETENETEDDEGEINHNRLAIEQSPEIRMSLKNE